MVTRKLKASEAREKPYLVWNAFIDLLANEEHANLSPEQRPAHFVFWYHSEVQNGGHYQYFVNQAGAHAAETIEALLSLGLRAQADVLARAMARWASEERISPSTVDHFIHDAELDEFGDLDREFHACPQTIPDALSAHLRAHEQTFVVLTETDAAAWVVRR
jgi:hypothetical protein